MESLNKLLANIAVAKQKVANLHWNVRGQLFYSIHKITDKLYKGLENLIDEVAEKIAMQGHIPLSTLRGYLDYADIQEIEPRAFNASEVIKYVIEDLNIIQMSADQVKGTNVIQPLLDEIYLFIDQHRWTFKSHQ